MTDKKDNKPNLKLLDGGKSNQDKTKKTTAVGVELTAKQLGFCKDIVGMGGKKGMTLVDAYRNNYNVSKDIKGNSLRAMSSKLRADVNITLTVNRLLAQKDSLQRMQTVSLGEQIIQDLLAFSKDENITDSVRVKSLELSFVQNIDNVELAAFNILDATGQLSVISLTHENKTPDPSLFTFAVPEGVYLDDQR